MSTLLDEMRNTLRRSFVDSANDTSSDFSIQNLPFGISSRQAPA
jgi:hypothetical protein